MQRDYYNSLMAYNQSLMQGTTSNYEKIFNEGYNHPGGNVGAALPADIGKMRAAYIDAGMTPAGAAAMLGNAGQESSFGANTAGDKDAQGNPTSGAMFQWHGDRYTGFIDWAKQNSLDPKDPMTSIRYSIIDMQKNFPDIWKQLTTSNDVDGLTRLVMDKFEVPAAATAHIDTRLNYAHSIYGQYGQQTEPAKVEVLTSHPYSSPEDAAKGGHVIIKDPTGQNTYPAPDDTKGTPTAQAFQPYQVAGPWEPPPTQGQPSAPMQLPGAVPPLQVGQQQPGLGAIPSKPGYINSTGANPAPASPQPGYINSTGANPAPEGSPTNTMLPASVVANPPLPPPRPGATPQSNVAATPAIRPSGWEYQPTPGNARVPMPVQWRPNWSPNPPIAQRQVAQQQAAPVATTPQPAISRTPPVQGQVQGRPLIPPPLPPPQQHTQEQPQQDVTQGIAQFNAANQAGTQAQLARDIQQDQQYIASAKGGAIHKFQAGGVAPASTYTPGSNASYDYYMSMNPGATPAQASQYADNAMLRSMADAWSNAAAANVGTGGWGNTQGANPAQRAADLSQSGYYLSQMQPVTQQTPTPAPAPTATPTPAPIQYTPLPALSVPSAASTAVTPAINYIPQSTFTGLIPPPTANSTVRTGANPNNTTVTSGSTTTTPSAGYNVNAYDQITSGAQAVASAAGYDDGGPVSPAIAGMPPGLGGQAPIPPIYYNPATYSAAGAPVGRGVTATSAPAYVAAPVPTFAQGGSVTPGVGINIGLQDGGDPDPSQNPNMQLAMYMPTGPQDYPPNYSQSNAPTDSAVYNPAPQGALPVDQASYMQFHRPIEMGRGPLGWSSGTTRLPGMGRMPRGPMPRAGHPQQPQMGVPNENLAPQGITPQNVAPQGPPPGAPPWTPQVMDQQGNGSHGFFDALVSGLKTLGEALGLSGPQGAISDPTVQQNRMGMVRGEGDASSGQMNEIYNRVDPSNSFDTVLRNVAGLEAVYNAHMLNGDAEGGGKVAAAMINYLSSMSSKYAGEAIKRYYKGDMQGVIDNLQQADAFIPDGQRRYAKLNANGKDVDVIQTNLKNAIEWQQTFGPEEILNAAIGVQNKSGFYQALEAAAYKYSPEFKQLADQKAEERRAQLVNQGLGQMYGGQRQGQPPAPQQVQQQPSVTPASTAPTSAAQASTPPALPGRDNQPGSTISAASAVPPPTPQQTDYMSIIGPEPQPPQSYGDPKVDNELWKAFQVQHSDWVRSRDQALGVMKQAETQQHADVAARERQDAAMKAQGRSQAFTERMTDIREKAARRREDEKPMSDADLNNAMLGFDETAQKAAFGNIPNLQPDQQRFLTGAVRQGQAYNKVLDANTIADFISGLVTSKYQVDKNTPLQDSSDGLRKTFVYGVPDPRDPNLTIPVGRITMPNVVMENVVQMRRANTPAPPAASKPAISYPGSLGLPSNVPSTPYRGPGYIAPKEGDRPLIPPAIPASQVPPEWRQQFPELNQ